MGEGIESARLALRPLDASPGHRALYCAVYGDPQVMRHVSEAVPEARMGGSFDASLHDSLAAPAFPSRWCIHRMTDGQGVGLLGAVHDPARRAVELGVLLVPAAQGRGFAQEALLALMTALASRGDVALFWGRHSHANTRMAGVLERLGFAPSQTSAGMCRWERPASGGLPR